MLVLALWCILPAWAASFVIPHHINTCSRIPHGVSRRQLSPTYTRALLANATDGDAEAEADVDAKTTEQLISELTELTRNFENVQSKVENNAKLYKETIESLQSKISNLEGEIRVSQKSMKEKERIIADLEQRNARGEVAVKLESDMIQEEAAIISTLDEEIDSKEKAVEDFKRQLEDAKSFSSVESFTTATTAHHAAVDVDLAEMRKEWEEEKQALLVEKAQLAESINSLKETIHNEAEVMRSEMKKEYNDMKRQSEAATKDYEMERLRMLDQLEEYEKERTSLRKLMVLGWQRLKSKIRFRRRNK